MPDKPNHKTIVRNGSCVESTTCKAPRFAFSKEGPLIRSLSLPSKLLKSALKAIY